MLKLRNTFRAVHGAGKPSGGRLGVAWLNGEFTAVACERGGTRLEWAAPDLVADTAGFARALKEAVARTDYRGKMVAVVLAHPLLTQRFVEVPPARGSAVRRYLERQVSQQKPFDGPAAWASRATLPTKAAGGAMLHVLPYGLHDELVQVCSTAGLHLALLTPLSEVLGESVRALPMAPEEITLFASTMVGTTVLVVVRGDGTPLLVRNVAESWTREVDRVALEFNRTQQFIQQQFGTPVGSVWLFGPMAAEKARQLASHLPLVVKAAPGEYDGRSWAHQVAAMSADAGVNLASREQREALDRRRVNRLRRVLAVGLLLIAAGVFTYTEYLRRRELAEVGRLRHERVGLRRRVVELRKQEEKIAGQRAFLADLDFQRSEPVHVWLLSTLGEVMPTDLRLTALLIRAQSNQWRFRLDGCRQTTSGRLLPVASADPLQQLRRALKDGPFEAAFDDTAPSSSGADTPTAWAARLRGQIPERNAEATRFSLEGTLR